jgi:hypothetical protein
MVLGKLDIHMQKKEVGGEHWCLTSVILATQEAEIRRVVIQSQPRQIVRETLSRKNLHKKGLGEWPKA